MTEPNVMKDALNVMIAINAAIRNLNMYPVTSTSAKNVIEKAYGAIMDVFDGSDTLGFENTGNGLAICGKRLGEKEQNSPHASGMLELMVNHEIGKIEFKKEMKIEELTVFLDAASKKPEEAESELESIISDKTAPNIVFGFKTADLGGDGGSFAGDSLEEIVIPLVRIMGEVLDEGSKDKISRKVAAFLAEKDDDLLAAVLKGFSGEELGEKIAEFVVQGMDETRFENMTAKIKSMLDSASEDEAESVKRAYLKMMQSEKGATLREQIKEREEKEKAEQENRRARLTTGINSIIKGSSEYFGDSVVMEALPRTIDQLMAKGKQDAVKTIFGNLSNGLSSKEANVRLETSKALNVVIDKFEEEERENLVNDLLPKLAEWIKIETSVSPALEDFSGRLRDAAREMIKNNEYPECNSLLEPFNVACSGNPPKNDEIRELASKTLREIGDEEAIAPLMDEFKTNKEKRRKQAIETLVQLGEVAAENLLELIKVSEDRYERSRILQVVGEIGSPAVQPIIERIGEGKPWYYMRNLVLLLGKVGNEDHLETVRPFIKHKDQRVRHEAVISIFNIGEDDSEDIFIEELPGADDELKPEIVRMLGALESEDAVPEILNLFENKSKHRNAIAESACVALGRIGSLEAIPALSGALEEKKKGLLSEKPFDEKVKKAAAHALEEISKNQDKPKKKKKKKKKKKADAGAPDPEKQARSEELAKQEAAVDEHVQKGETGEAVKLLGELVQGYAEIQNFLKADEMKDKMSDVDPMALTEIYNAGEILEKEKAKFIDEDYLKQWDIVFGQLTPEETNALFYSLAPLEMEPEQTVFGQGEMNTRLFFIDEGELRLTYTFDGEEVEIKTIGPGTIAGQDTVFPFSICTFSMATVSDVTARFLEKSIMGRWSESLPALESKLRDICMKNTDNISEILEKNELDRRAKKRANMSGGIATKLLDDSGKPEGNPIKGDLANVCDGGLSFLAKTPPDIVPGLLNRKLRMVFNLPLKKGARKMDMTGIIVAVKYEYENDYSIHVKFDRKLSQSK